MHVAMNRVDHVVVHYLQMSLHAISLRKMCWTSLCGRDGRTLCGPQCVIVIR